MADPATNTKDQSGEEVTGRLSSLGVSDYYIYY